ncbi:MAG TPA: 2Fe-2S iron-sulfur cluster-binding protein [Solimonas sp.]|nr:2Fe-2S iron-sulfur cluster-binding protein [Solimonas sp.]
MAKILYIEHNGTEHLVDAEVGKSVMQNAVENLVPGIVGDCGGACSCATCHGYVDAAWEGKVEPKNETEEVMLEGAMRVECGSRLTCQIMMKPELDGIVVRLPVSQF